MDIKYGISKEARDKIKEVVLSEMKRVTKFNEIGLGTKLEDSVVLELLYLQTQINTSVSYEFAKITASSLHSKFRNGEVK